MENELKKHHLRLYHQRFTPQKGCNLELWFPVASDEIVSPFKIEKKKKHHLRLCHQRFTPPEGCKLELQFPMLTSDKISSQKLHI